MGGPAGADADSAASASADAGSVVLGSCTVVETRLTQESLVEPATEGEGAGQGQMADHAQNRVIHAQEHTSANEVKRRTDAAASPHANRKGRTVKRHQLTVAPQAVPTTKPWSCGGDVGAKKMMPLALIDKE